MNNERFTLLGKLESAEAVDGALFLALIFETMTMFDFSCAELGVKFGVPASYVRRWLKGENLPLPATRAYICAELANIVARNGEL